MFAYLLSNFMYSQSLNFTARISVAAILAAYFSQLGVATEIRAVKLRIGSSITQSRIVRACRNVWCSSTHKPLRSIISLGVHLIYLSRR